MTSENGGKNTASIRPSLGAASHIDNSATSNSDRRPKTPSQPSSCRTKPKTGDGCGSARTSEAGRPCASSSSVSISRLDMGKFLQRATGAGSASTTSQLLGFQHFIAQQGPHLVPHGTEFRQRPDIFAF